MSTLAETDVLMGSHTSCLVNTPSTTRDEQPSDMDLKKKRTIDSDSLSVETTSTYEVSVNSRAIPRLKSVKEEAPTIVVVDPWSTGNTLCKEIVKKGFKLIVVWEKNRVRSQTLPAMETVMCLNFDVAVEQLRQLATKYNIKSVVPGSETGVPLSEKLGNALGYPTNPPRFAEARRNKYLMAETLRAKGVRAVKQTITNDINEAVAFVEQMNPTPFRVIVKPNMGAGSDDVFLCKDMEDFKVKFSIINGKCNSLGLTNDGVLVQEYLTGVEYVIDTVSRNGCHKVASIWAYDKREANGRFNVYYGSFPLVNNSELTNTMIEYIFQVLDALEIRNSPAHAEVKMTETGPCLVEVGSRCHGGGGVWLPMAKRVWGLDQLEMVADDFSCDADKVSTPKPFPTKHLEHGVILDMVSYEDGEITEIPGDDFIKNLPSFSEVTYFCKVGDRLKQSVDCNTVPGSIVLIHPSEEQVVNDYNLIHDLLRQKDGYFKLMRNT